MKTLRALTARGSLRAVWGTSCIAAALYLVVTGQPVPELLAAAFGALILEFAVGHRSAS